MEDLVLEGTDRIQLPESAQLMNPAGLSPEAEVRLRRQADGDGTDLHVPPLRDAGQVRAWRRRQHDAWGEDHTQGEAEHVPVKFGSIPCLSTASAVTAINRESARRPVLMHLHGGGFCLGSPGTDIPITARFAAQADVVSVDYRLAPEHPYPAALDDSVAVHQALTESGPTVISGISAGANLAVGVALRCSALGGAAPAGLALLSPHLSFATREPLGDLSEAYVDSADRSDPFVSPACASDAELATLPATLIQVTSTESLYDTAIGFAERLISVGVQTTLQVWDGLWHAWHYHRELPEAWQAVDGAAEWAASLD